MNNVKMNDVKIWGLEFQSLKDNESIAILY